MKQIRDALEWFDELIHEIRKAVDMTRGAASNAVLKSNDNEARLLIEQAEAMEKCGKQVETLRKEWASIKKISLPRKYVRKKSGALSGSRLKKGQRTPEKEFVLPILRVLESMGGGGKVKDILTKVHQEMKGKLKPIDITPLTKDGKPRWFNTGQWARNSMVNEGLMKKNSPRGIWEISDKGRESLKKAQSV
ncbi:winged helix-turn-helix domain-containing protein [Candidatus Sumerlaeota bacterium]|nr:winged helix-turn-helix domain-containing protein [Candidatus Sumerlaeota bacterium]